MQRAFVGDDCMLAACIQMHGSFTADSILSPIALDDDTKIVRIVLLCDGNLAMIRTRQWCVLDMECDAMLLIV